jgi:hypothetical protein
MCELRISCLSQVEITILDWILNKHCHHIRTVTVCTLFGRLKKRESIEYGYKDTGQQKYPGRLLMFLNLRLLCEVASAYSVSGLDVCFASHL